MSRLKRALFGTNDLATDLGLLLLRCGFGLSMLLAHGIGKVPPSEGFIARASGMGFPAPEFFAWMSGLSEAVGGLLLVLGFLTRPAAVALAVTMGVAFFLAHGGDPFSAREKSLLFGVAALALLAMGPGRFSVDRWIEKSGRAAA